MPTKLQLNPDFDTLFVQCTRLKELQNKANIALSMGATIHNVAEQRYNVACGELSKLHNQYKALLDWLNLPNQKAELEEFAKHWVCPFLNAFFSA